MTEFRDPPLPRPEPGTHLAPIVCLDTDRDGRFAVTASADGTARVWAADSGLLLRTLRPPLGLGKEERPGAVAISPDGETIVVAGQTLYLFDRSSGRLRERIDGPGAPVTALRFAPDGSRLSVLAGDPFLWRLGEKSFLPLEAGPGRCRALAFDGSGRLATLWDDATIRLLDAQGALAAMRPAPDGAGQPSALAFSPNGKELAVAFDAGGRVEILSASDLQPLLTPDAGNGGYIDICWSCDGRTVFAGGSGGLRLWGQGGRERGVDALVRAPVTALRPMIPDGVLFATATPEWGRIADDNRVALSVPPGFADFRDGGLRVSADGLTVDIAGDQPVRIALAERRCSPLAGASPAEAVRSMALDDGRTLAVHDAVLTLSDARGMVLAEAESPAAVRTFAVSGDGRLLIAAHADGTIRWHRLDTLEELLVLFLHAGRERWVAWTPTGYYMASPGGESLLGWHVGNGPERAADFLAAGRLRERFLRPDIVILVLETLDEGVALRRAELDSLRAGLPPVLRIVTPEDGTRVAAESVLIGFEVATAGGAETREDVRVRVRVDGRPIAGEPVFHAAPGRLTRIAVPLPHPWSTIDALPDDADLPVHVTLLPATSDGLAGEPDTVRLTLCRSLLPSLRQPRRPRLFVLACGVSDHADHRLRLRFGHKDALDMAAFFEWQKTSGLFEEVTIRLRTDRHVTQEVLRDDLAWLQAVTEPDDIAVVFLAGHGVSTERQSFYFLTSDVDPAQPQRRAFPGCELIRALSAVRGKTIAFLDINRAIAESGHAMPPDMDALVNELASAENGVVAFAACTGHQYSVERPDWRNGAFAKALLEGLDGDAADTQGRVRLDTLASFVHGRVLALTEGAQAPGMIRPDSVRDIEIAFIREKATV